MNLNSEHLKAMLRVKHLRNELIDEQITEEDCRNYENIDKDKKEFIKAQVLFVMNNGYANTILTYSNPEEQYIDPIKIFGEKGIYLVSEIDWEIFTFFTKKKEALDYANKAMERWLEMFNDES